jgi:hypothetical protein
MAQRASGDGGGPGARCDFVKFFSITGHEKTKRRDRLVSPAHRLAHLALYCMPGMNAGVLNVREFFP